MATNHAEVMALLREISTQLSDVQASVKTRKGGASSGGAAEEEELKEQVEALDTWLKDKVEPFAAQCEKIGAPEMGVQAKAGYKALREFVNLAANCVKPAQDKIMGFASGMVDVVKQIGNDKRDARGKPTEFHTMAWAEAFQPSVSWTLSNMPPPKKLVQDQAIDGAMFYINKVRRAHKGEADHDNWVKALLQMLNALRDYVAEYHKAGLEWVPKAMGGKDPATFKSSSSSAPAPAAGGASKGPGVPVKKSSGPAPPPLPMPKKATNTNTGGGGNMADVFNAIKNIDQSSGRTAGLRRTKKNAEGKRVVENDKSGVMTDAKRKKLEAMRGSAGKSAVKKAAATKKKKEPVKKLTQTKWQIENQTGMCELAADEVKVKHTIYIYGCEGATIIINGKCNAVIVDNCKKTNVLFDESLGGCEVVNCKQLKVQCRKTCPTVAIDKTDGITVYLSRDCYRTATVVASKSSEMNLSWPGKTDDDAWVESPIPEQYQHKIQEDGTISCDVSDLYSH